VIAAVLIFAGQSSHAEPWRALVEQVLRPVPVLGTARRSLALSRLAAALEALISAGVTIIEAWELAAKASGSPALRRTVLSWRPQLNAGRTPAEILSTSSPFPELFSHQYATGEISGKLDDTLKRLHAYYHEESMRKTRALARWIPLAIYLFIIFRIAMYIVHFYTGYFQQIRDATSF
jgi:type II secretory pathway component PulF